MHPGPALALILDQRPLFGIEHWLPEADEMVSRPPSGADDLGVRLQTMPERGLPSVSGRARVTPVRTEGTAGEGGDGVLQRLLDFPQPLRVVHPTASNQAATICSGVCTARQTPPRRRTKLQTRLE